MVESLYGDERDSWTSTHPCRLNHLHVPLSAVCSRMQRTEGEMRQKASLLTWWMGITYKITHRGSDDRNRANCCIVSVDCCCAQTWMNVLPIRASPADVVSTSCSITPVSALTDALESTANTVCLFTHGRRMQGIWHPNYLCGAILICISPL